MAQPSGATDRSITFSKVPSGTIDNDTAQYKIINNEKMCCINRYDAMPPFLMSLVSDSDLWMYISSYGALTSGRIDEEHCLFPYMTDDQLHRFAGQSGPVTIVKVRNAAGFTSIWEPFSSFPSPNNIERNCYKSILSNIIVFEEIHHGLGLIFRYSWRPSDRFGFVRTSSLENIDGTDTVEVEIVDGLVNILAAGVPLRQQQSMSCLSDAYTQCEIDMETGLGIFALTAVTSDRPEPLESLISNVVWSHGLEHPVYLLSTDQLPAFRDGDPISTESLLQGRRGAYFVSSRFILKQSETKCWYIVADVYKDQPYAQELITQLTDAGLSDRIESSIAESSATLAKYVGNADGWQLTGDQSITSHLTSCVLFNIMRGGLFDNHYNVMADDYRKFLTVRNKNVIQQHNTFLNSLPESILYAVLIKNVQQQPDNTDLLRLTYEYLPLTFSRRHGDPSRPWNRFGIHVKNADGSRILNYQGNWRDIFQNWEALGFSYPVYLPSMVAKFLNACTPDGYNPLGVTRDCIYWEAPEPDNPWSNIGYWGDHQIIYLLKLLEATNNLYPETLDRWLSSSLFSFANVPYRIKPYEDIVKDCKNTVVYDFDLAKQIFNKEAEIGTDGRLLFNHNCGICHTNLTEKLIILMLAKLSNLVPGGGIWMNTQRPEWNDANNALVGNGVSMVTLCYLRRFVSFCLELFSRNIHHEISLSVETLEWLRQITGVFQRNMHLLDANTISDSDRRMLLDQLGLPYSSYRQSIYNEGFTTIEQISISQCIALCKSALPYIDQSILANRRSDNLYHAYNLIRFTNSKSAAIEHLYEILEGQVAVLSSGLLSPFESVEVVEGLLKSKMYREDQKAFMLYPARNMPSFLEKNIIPPIYVDNNPLLYKLIEKNDTSIIVRDIAGSYRFNRDLINAEFLNSAIDRLARIDQWTILAMEYKQQTLNVYEAVFHHHEFTGRSGSMFGYEGIGCIYWHMMAKLLLAIQENFRRAAQLRPGGAGITSRSDILHTLAAQYYRLREGMGFNKTPYQYGAFPPDPYSHTPRHSGARQPGMTGQTKEDILTRWGELGVSINEGKYAFHPALLRKQEFLTESTPLQLCDLNGTPYTIYGSKNTLIFTIGMTPVVYILTSADMQIRVYENHECIYTLYGNTLDDVNTEHIIHRTGKITRLEVLIPESMLYYV